MLDVYFFGRLADIAGKSHHIEISNEMKTLNDVMDYLGSTNAELQKALENRGNFLVIDDAMASGEDSIVGAQSVSFGAPVSGG